MKKYLSLIIVAVLLVGCLPACSSKSSSSKGSTGASDDGIQIVTTIFPEYDWVMNILGDNPADAEVTMLLDNGVDLHSYQPSADDILKISTCDLFIYVGGESDEWVEDALEEAVNKDMVVVNLMDVLGESVKQEEVVEGMQESEHEHGDADDTDDHDDADTDDADDHDDADTDDADNQDDADATDEHEHEHDEVEYDEHVWLSLKNAATLTEYISEQIQTIDADNADVYEENTKAYVDSINALDTEYENAVAAAENKTLVFGDRFPFRYMTDDYNLTYYAAFVGCSAETEASFETITFLAGKVDELNLDTVLTIEGNDHSIAETIVSNTQSKDQKILTLDSMQATTSDDVADGVTYMSVMEKNLEVLKEAL